MEKIARKTSPDSTDALASAVHGEIMSGYSSALFLPTRESF
jgi:hypothetical protein